MTSPDDHAPCVGPSDDITCIEPTINAASSSPTRCRRWRRNEVTAPTRGAEVAAAAATAGPLAFTGSSGTRRSARRGGGGWCLPRVPATVIASRQAAGIRDRVAGCQFLEAPDRPRAPARGSICAVEELRGRPRRVAQTTGAGAGATRYPDACFERLAELETEMEKLESQLSELYASGDQQAAAAAGRRLAELRAGGRGLPRAAHHGDRARRSARDARRRGRRARCASTSRARSPTKQAAARRARRPAPRAARARAIPTTARTSSSRSAAAKAARRATSGPPTSSRCTSATPTSTGGRSRCSPASCPTWAGCARSRSW